MTTTTVNSPISHDGLNTAGMALAFAFGRARMERALYDNLDMLSLGMVRLKGDFADSKSTTIRVTHVDGIGFDLPMSELSGETDTVAPSPVDFGYSDIALGMYGVSHAQTYLSMVTGSDHGMDLDTLMSMVPESYARTIRDLACIAGSGFATSVGSATAALAASDYFDLATEYRLNIGSKLPRVAVAPRQLDQLKRSFGAEPAFQNASSELAGLLGLAADAGGTLMRVHRNFAGMGMDIAETDSIVQSGGAYQGFATPDGGIGFAVGNTSPIKTANPQGTQYIQNYGIVTEELPGGGAQTVRQYRATAFVGVGTGSPRVYTQRRLVSKVP